MVPLTSLWLPIILSAVIVFLASSLIHMVLGYHRDDYRKVPNEEEAMRVMRALDIPPGDYAMPRAGSMAEMKQPEFVEKVKAGPVVFMTVLPKGPSSMGSSLLQWFLYCLLLSTFAAYVASRALGPGADYLSVFRFAGTTAFAGYSLALLQHSIWYKRSWRTTLLSMFDGLVFALLTAGTLGWLWPR